MNYNKTRRSALRNTSGSPIIPISSTFHEDANINKHLPRRAMSEPLSIQNHHHPSEYTSITHKTNSMIKLLLIGDTGVGKSALIISYCDNFFDERNVKSTVGVDLKVKVVNVDGEYFKTVLWDTAGQERYRNVIPSLYKGSNGVILTYDVTNMDSFRDLYHWINECNENCDTSKTLFYLVGNKLDCDDKKVSKEDIRNLLSHVKDNYPNFQIKASFEVSARYPTLVYGLFDLIIKDLVENRCYFDERRLRNKKSIDLSTARDREQSCCSY